MLFQIHQVHRVVVVQRGLAERLAQMVPLPFQIAQVLREQMLNRAPLGQVVQVALMVLLHPQTQPRVLRDYREQVEEMEVRGQVEQRALAVV